MKWDLLTADTCYRDDVSSVRWPLVFDSAAAGALNGDGSERSRRADVQRWLHFRPNALQDALGNPCTLFSTGAAFTFEFKNFGRGVREARERFPTRGPIIACASVVALTTHLLVD